MQRLLLTPCYYVFFETAEKSQIRWISGRKERDPLILVPQTNGCSPAFAQTSLDWQEDAHHVFLGWITRLISCIFLPDKMIAYAFRDALGASGWWWLACPTRVCRLYTALGQNELTFEVLKKRSISFAVFCSSVVSPVSMGQSRGQVASS